MIDGWLKEPVLERKQTRDGSLVDEEIFDSFSKCSKSTGRGIIYPDSVVMGVSLNCAALFP
jgi:hypothetical protein